MPEKWEYLIVTWQIANAADLQSQLNVFGERGWELVSFGLPGVNPVQQQPDSVSVLFKRRIVSGSEE